MKRYYCPHCGERRLSLEIDPRLGVDPAVLACLVCGFRLYGEEAVRDLVARQDDGIVSFPSQPPDVSTPPAVEPAPRRPDASAPAEVAHARRRGGRAVPCSLCGAPVWRRPWDVRASGSGHFFCCREHLYEHRRRTFGGRSASGVAHMEPVIPENERVGRVRPPKRAHRRDDRRGAQAVTCALCGQRVWRRPWDVRDSKSGLFFCSREHRTRFGRRGRPETRTKPAPTLPHKQAS